VYVIYQFIFFFEEGPTSQGLLPFPLIAICIGTILLSRNYIKEYFKSRQILTILLAFMILALVLDNFYEIALQIGEPMHPILWIDLLIRIVFFIPWIHMWLVLLYYFDFSVKQTFYIAALQGIIIEYLFVWLLTNETHRVEYYISNLGYLSIIVIPFDILVVLVLYGCNIAVPYSPFREIVKENVNQREVKPVIKYTLSLIPVIAFPIAYFMLQRFIVPIIIYYA
jgi:hypothetical protein